MTDGTSLSIEVWNAIGPTAYSIQDRASNPHLAEDLCTLEGEHFRGNRLNATDADT